MPPFLDELLDALSGSIEGAVLSGQAEKAIALAKESRLTASVLKSVSTKAGENDAALVNRWKHAVSERFVGRLRVNLDKAYDGIGAAAIRRCWMWLGFPALAAAAAAFPCRFGSLSVQALSRLPAIIGMDATVVEFVASVTLGLSPVCAWPCWQGGHRRGLPAWRSGQTLAARRGRAGGCVFPSASR